MDIKQQFPSSVCVISLGKYNPSHFALDQTYSLPPYYSKRSSFLSQKVNHETVLILDFGSQYTQLIARRVREAGVYCEILPFNTSVATIKEKKPRGLILSGGPSSVYQKDAPLPDKELLSNLGCPLLGICYGLQVVARDLGGEVQSAPSREFGYARLKVTDPESVLFRGLPTEMDVWMSHGDNVT